MSAYQRYIRPLLQQAHDRGAGDLLLISGDYPKLRMFGTAGIHQLHTGNMVSLTSEPRTQPVTLRDFLDEVGIEMLDRQADGYLGPTVRFHVDATRLTGLLTVAFRHLLEIPESVGPENSGNLVDLIRSGKRQHELINV